MNADGTDVRVADSGSSLRPLRLCVSPGRVDALGSYSRPMARCRADQSIQRVEMAGFAFALGVYPVDPLEPKCGYTTAFEPADEGGEPGVGGGETLGEGSGDWEEWPDRYVFDILVPATRVEPLCRALYSLMPGRVFPILDFLGQDEWREVDPYVSYDLLGMDRFMDTLRRFRSFFYEDGLVGFGVMSEEPFLYVFVDEHKVVTVRVEASHKERVEKILSAFDLELLDELKSADSVTHEHRSVLETADDRPDLLAGEEIVEVLRDEWRLVLNIDPERNVDEEGNDLGVTGWRFIVRYDPPAPEAAEAEEDKEEDKGSENGGGAAKPAKPEKEGGEEKPLTSRYAEIFLTADSLHRATDLALEALEELLARAKIEIDVESTPEPLMIAADRWNTEDFIKAVTTATGQKPDLTESGVHHSLWLN